MDITKKLKKDLIGYLSLFIIISVIISAHTLIFFMFLLFIYLLTDITTNGLHSKFPFLSKTFLFYTFYMVMILGFFTISLRIIPDFIIDLPTYTKQIETEITKLILMLCKKFNLTLDLNMTTGKIFEESTKAIKSFVIIFKGLSKGFVFFLFALILNFLLFHDKESIEKIFTSKTDSLMTYLYNFLNFKFSKFYFYFQKVMGGQVIISLINTCITAILVFTLDLPHKISLISLIFICGLLPVIGNIISNTILSVTAFFSSGVWACVSCLFLLIAIHKFEYFLNGKIIGSIVKLPMFVTLLALLIGESILGIWGLILAIPFVLFIKSELEDMPVEIVK